MKNDKFKKNDGDNQSKKLSTFKKVSYKTSKYFIIMSEKFKIIILIDYSICIISANL